MNPNQSIFNIGSEIFSCYNKERFTLEFPCDDASMVLKLLNKKFRGSYIQYNQREYYIEKPEKTDLPPPSNPFCIDSFTLVHETFLFVNANTEKEDYYAEDYHTDLLLFKVLEEHDMVECVTSFHLQPQLQLHITDVELVI